MKVVGFNYAKISIDKKKNPDNSLKIETNVTVLDIKEADSKLLKTKETILEISFEYTINYNPGFAKIDLDGKFILTADPKNAKEVLTLWKKKELSPSFRISLFNAILKKTASKALQLEDELNLPPHFSPPVLKLEEKK